MRGPQYHANFEIGTLDAAIVLTLTLGWQLGNRVAARRMAKMQHLVPWIRHSLQ
jgi:hypothetical protein